MSAGFVALITARVVLINGPERWDKCYDEFDDGRPPSLKTLLVNDKGQLEWAALLISQLPDAYDLRLPRLECGLVGGAHRRCLLRLG